MRDLKFMVWNTKNSLPLGGPYSLQKIIQLRARPTASPYINTDDCVFPQYVGMEDCNGKEIYEYFILKAISYQEGKEKSVIGEVVFCLGSLGFELRYRGEKGYVMDDLRRFDKLEIIGNRFENSELMKDE